MICPILLFLSLRQERINSRRRGCGNVGIRRGGPDFQARWKGWETRLRSFPGFPRRVISTAWRARTFCGAEPLPLRRVAPHHVRPVDDRHPPVQVFTDPDPATGQGASPARPLQLPHPSGQSHRVVVSDHALMLHREDPIQVPAPHRHESMPALRRRSRELTVHLRDCSLAQEPVRFLQRPNPGQAQLLRQPPLPGPKAPLAASPRLRRVGGDHFDLQLLQRPPHLRQPPRIDRPACLRRLKEMARPVAIERAESSLALDHFRQRRHHRARRFFFHQLRVVGFVGRVVEHLDQVIPAVVLEPLVMTPIQVQQHPRQRPRRPPLAVYAALPRLLHQPRSLQGQLDPRVAQPDAMLFPQLLVKVPHVEVVVALLIEPQHFFHGLQRHALGARSAPAPVEQPVVAVLLVAAPPAPHAPVADAENLRRLPPRDPLRQRPQNHLLNLHRPLHGGRWICMHSASPQQNASSPHRPQRTDHVRIGADISCANDTSRSRGCKRPELVLGFAQFQSSEDPGWSSRLNGTHVGPNRVESSNNRNSAKGEDMTVKIQIYIALWISLLVPAWASASTYYINCSKGSDNNAGTSASTAWKTIARANLQTYLPGDSILLKRGCVWSEPGFKSKGNGAAGSPITLADYGTGALPEIIGSGDHEAAVLLENVQYWTVRNLNLTQTGQSPQALCFDSSNDCDVRSDEYMRAVVHVLGLGGPAGVQTCGDPGTGCHIRLENLDVHDGSWNGIYVSGGFYQLNTGVFGYVEDVVVTGVESWNHHKSGIQMTCTYYKTKIYATKDIQVLDSNLHDNGGDGAMIGPVENGLVDGNNCAYNGRLRHARVGCWTWDSLNTTTT